VSGSGIRWATCKSAPRCRQITTQRPTTHFFSDRMPFLPHNKQRQSTCRLQSNVCRFVACVTQESLCGSCLHTGSDRTSRCVLRTWPAYWRRESACHSLPSVPSTSTCSWSNVRYACSKLRVYVIIRLIMTKYSVYCTSKISDRAIRRISLLQLLLLRCFLCIALPLIFPVQ